MKIIYLHQYFNTPATCGSTRSYEMARRLADRGHDVHMVTSDTRANSRDDRNWFTTGESGFTVHWFPNSYSNQMTYSRRIQAFFSFAWAAMRKSAELGGDVIFASSTPLTIAIPAIHAAKRNQIPMVLEVRDLWPEAPIKMGALRNPLSIALARLLERRAYHNSARIVALAPRLKTGVVAKGFNSDHVTVIPNCCDFDLFDVSQQAGLDFRSKHAWLEERPLVVYTGTIGRINGVDYLVRVAAALRDRHPHIRIAIVGTGCEEEKVKNLAESLRVLNRNFFMLGNLPKQQLPAVLSACDLATSTCVNVKELSADSANKFFDALAAGRAIAINHEGWLADLIRLRQMGLVLDPEDADRAAQSVADALAEKTWAARAGRAAGTVGRELFDRDLLAKQLETVLFQATGATIDDPMTNAREDRKAA